MPKQDTFQNYAKDVEKYLPSKLPDIPLHVMMEIGEYISNKTANLIQDVLKERDKQWQSEWRKQTAAWERDMRRGASKKEKKNAET